MVEEVEVRLSVVKDHSVFGNDYVVLHVGDCVVEYNLNSGLFHTVRVTQNLLAWN